MARRKEKPSDLDRLYKAIEEGKTAEQFYSQKPVDRENNISYDERVRMAGFAIADLPNVGEVRREWRKGSIKFQTRDLVVFFSNGQDPAHVKVEANHDGVVARIREIAARFDIPYVSSENLGLVFGKFKGMRLIFVVGDNPDEIKTQFEEQLNALNAKKDSDNFNSISEVISAGFDT